MELASMKLEFLRKAETVDTRDKEVSKLIKSIENVKKWGQPQRAVVGVVGGTGAGKSSVINALLDEKSLVPTSGMRACTAVITEISHNYSSSPDAPYRAEVHFISAKDWGSELCILLDELKSNTETSCVDLSEGEVGIAYSKLKAVYPGITKNELLSGQHTPESLVQHPSVINILDRTVEIAAQASDGLAESLKEYIDSPLVKVVKIFVKSPVLESGLVLVDLPGVHDSNAARSAVAAEYVAECSGLWVVAPITRAVDDKSAQTLLGESFKRQLQIDGSYSAITFICSKTDDISVPEILRAMPDTEMAHETNKQLQILETELDQLKSKLAPLEKRSNELRNQILSRVNEISGLEKAVQNARNESSVTTISVSPSKKRKQRLADFEARKRVQTAVLSGSEDSDDDELAVSDCEVEEEVSLEKADQILRELKEEQATAVKEKSEIANEVKPARKRKKDVSQMVADSKSLLMNQCLEFRSNFCDTYHQAAVCRWVEGVAFEHDPDNFDPGAEARNYQEVAQNLPVFCVSSRLYQHKRGIVVDKTKPSYIGFRTLEDTQIPQLQAHATSIARDMRVADCRNFLGLLGQCLTSMMIQVVLADKPLKITDDIRGQELRFLDNSVYKLRKDIDATILGCFKSMNNVLKSKILDKFPAAAVFASEEASRTVSSWGKTRKVGGLSMTTYRAACARATRCSALEEFGTAMGKRVLGIYPKRLDSLAEKFAVHLANFQAGLDKRPEITKATSYGLVKEQTMRFTKLILDTTVLKSSVDSAQKDANRMFVPTIAASMSGVYLACGRESGLGSITRIREHMKNHMANFRHVMFQQAVRRVEEQLVDMMKDMQEAVEDRLRGITAEIEEDFRSLIEGKMVSQTFMEAREELRKILLSADERFHHISEARDHDINLLGPMIQDEPMPAPVGTAVKTELAT